MPDLAWWAWALLCLAAIVVGVSKTAVPGANAISVAIFAALLPARQSTGALLVLLLVADLFAIVAYRRHVDWATLLRLAPAVVAGLLLGVLFLAFADDEGVRRVIGALLLAVIAFTLGWRRLRRAVEDPGPHRLAAATYGTLGGFTTMVANAAGPVMSMYFLAARFPVKLWLGTAAWSFFLINVSKLPFSIGLGLITPSGLLLDLVLVPLVVAGALSGRWLAGRLDQRLFERLVIGFTVVGALYLLLAP
ncbi:sulfite exporter TauE/SafE family protein [Microbacterium sp. BWT-B31]|uniref:sulfite exporter TauE/SafE family protein n=1 Tax=Microbacterium sp. BWT-B31 TaxID=3232072 RepID=UPI0035278271